MEAWKTADGDEIPLEKMTDSHVRNAYAFVSRRLEGNAFKDDQICDVSEVELSEPTPGDAVSEFAAECAALRVQASSDRAWMARFEAEAARRAIDMKVYFRDRETE